MKSVKDEYDDLLRFENLHSFFLDYLWVFFVYASCGFWTATFIDNFLSPDYTIESLRKLSSLHLYLTCFLQFALQGFLAIFVSAILHKVPTPAVYIPEFGLTKVQLHIIRNPAIFSIILFTTSKSLQDHLYILMERFNRKIPPSEKNAKEESRVEINSHAGELAALLVPLK